MDKGTLDFYNAKVGDYVSKFAKGKPKPALLDFIAAMPHGGRVLDFGCGPGNSAAHMVEAGLNVDATDASSGMVRIAREEFGVNAEQSSFQDLDAVALYDGIWANFSLLHAPKSETPEILSKMHRAMKSGGHLHLGLKIGEGEERDHLGRMYSFFQRNELEALLCDAGFTPQSYFQGAEKGLAGTLDPFMIVTARA